jgi:hypothetical protein
LDSPTPDVEAVICLTSCTGVGEPCFCRFSTPITSTGRAAFLGVPAM